MKIGFACKYKHDLTDEKENLKIEKEYNTTTTTLRYMNTLDQEKKEEKLFEVISHNLNSNLKLIEYVNTLPEELKMLRISSDLLPFYTLNEYKYIYKKNEFTNLIESKLKEFGNYARKNNIRLSMHPDQFCVLASDKDNVIENSIKEFEYHTDLIRMMEYGKEFQDFKCNVHIGGAKGFQGIIDILPKLSKEARNVITIENDEKKHGLDECLKLKKYCPIVLDIHHHWCREGERINVSDNRIKDVIESWRGVRPTMHYSQSRESLKNIGQSENEHFDMNAILQKKVTKKDLYAHSDMLWNKATNNYAKDFLEYFDIMVEAKNKNRASIEFFHSIKK